MPLETRELIIQRMGKHETAIDMIPTSSARMTNCIRLDYVFKSWEGGMSKLIIIAQITTISETVNRKNELICNSIWFLEIES
jgi:hypothetical protein